MWVRNSILVAATVAVGTLSWACPAQAEGPVSKPAPAVSLPGGDHVYTPPAVLGAAWAQAVRAVVDGVKHLVDQDKVETEKAVCPREVPPASGRAGGPRTPAIAPPVVPAWHPGWTPGSSLRDSLGPSPIQVGPVAVAPPAEAGRDTRGEHAVLLGARMELPWMVP